MHEENTSKKSRKRISPKKLPNKKFHQDHNTSTSTINSTPFQSASFVSQRMFHSQFWVIRLQLKEDFL
jgi:hypothetical protein